MSDFARGGANDCLSCGASSEFSLDFASKRKYPAMHMVLGAFPDGFGSVPRFPADQYSEAISTQKSQLGVPVKYDTQIHRWDGEPRTKKLVLTLSSSNSV